MGLYLKITAGLLLIMHAFHPALLQETTDSPGRTIDKSWLRGLAKNTADNQNSAAGEEEEYDHIPDTTTVEPSNDYGGVASGYMAIDQNIPENKTAEDLITTTLADELPDITPSATTTTTTVDNTNSSQVNMTQAEEETHNSTTIPQTTITTQNSTSFPDFFNHTDLQSTTLAPESNITQETTTKSAEDIELTDTTESTSTITTTTAMTPEINKTTTASSTTPYPSETTKIISETTTEIIPETTTADVTDAPDIGNKAGDDAASGSSSERGLASDARESNRAAWAAVLGTALAVACVGLVAYVILKKKRQKAFSHRKLVEEYPSDPVLRLDNSEPLDLNFGGSAYYNPGLQGDNIQMTNFPGRHRN